MIDPKQILKRIKCRQKALSKESRRAIVSICVSVSLALAALLTLAFYVRSMRNDTVERYDVTGSVSVLSDREGK